MYYYWFIFAFLPCSKTIIKTENQNSNTTT